MTARQHMAGCLPLIHADMFIEINGAEFIVDVVWATDTNRHGKERHCLGEILATCVSKYH